MMRSMLTAFLMLAASLPSATLAADRPNVLWITAEDMSPVLGCYGDEYAVTPHLDAFAKESVLYTNAFATAPVCSPSRSCLINGVPAPTLGTHNMRSAFPIPDEMTGFPSFMRKVGYYTSNNVKTDYNTANWEKIIAASWNESSPKAHWRKRKNGQAFFSIFNLMTSHQSRSMVWPYEKFKAEVQSRLSPDQIHDPAKAPLPPYYPDTPVVRKTVARFYDCVTAMDKEVGDILKQLEADGLADDTIVFFYSDHGSGMPRHKRALLDSGMKVALIVRFPEKWRHLAPSKPGTKTDRLVSFDDFGPTVLSLTGVDIPAYMTGRPFLGPKAAVPRDYVFGHRDRVDEVIDMARSVRDKRYLYIRNFMPHLGYNQPTAWPDQGDIRHEFYRLADRSKMTDAQWHFAGPTRPIEELYDCATDPHNLHNLADSSGHAVIRERMSDAMINHMDKNNDLGLIPEADLWDRIGDEPPMSWIRKKELDSVLVPALAATRIGSGQDEESLVIWLRYPQDSAARYWGAVGLGGLKSLDSKSARALKAALNDLSSSVRIEAANALARHGHSKKALPVLAKALEDKNLAAVLHAARAIELLGDKAAPLAGAMAKVKDRLATLRPKDVPATVVLPGDLDMAMFIGFSVDAFLAKHAPGSGPGSSPEGAPVSKTSGGGGGGDGWIDLFDGKTLAGWTPKAKGDAVTVEVVDGEIHLMSKGKNLWVAHESTFDDFELEAEAIMPANGYNSGLAFRGATSGKFTGYQCEIDRGKSGMIYAIGKGWVWPKGKDEQARFKEMAGGSFKNGQWNRFRVRCEGDHIQVWVNGVKTADVRDQLFAKGVVAIQHHGKGDVHRFRNLRVRPLD